jgi:hypothetical protein
MPNDKSHKSPKRDEVAKRIDFLLKHLWNDNQRSMAAEIGCSQAVLSMVVNGKRPPGRKLVELIAAFPRVNPVWLQSGSGEPILARAALDSLPVSEQILPKPPLECRDLLLSERYPVTPEQFAQSRYWLRISRNQPAVESKLVKVRADDLLLIESDTHNLQLWDFRGLAVVRLPKGDETEIRLCRIWPESQTPGETVFNVDPFEREAKRGQLVRRTTTEEYPDGTKRTWETFAEVVPEQQKGKTGAERWRTTTRPVHFHRKVMSDSVVAVAVQLVRARP